ncbi:MAG: molybdate ABC transporter substrate-binding protein [Gammaproteobacteria bacterium]|nr:MAG: molybdate ABC transporter substrate-binding protein [Gammaproteobacteria bacterium]
MRRYLSAVLLCCLLAGAAAAGPNEPLRVAVASNFLPVARALAERFEQAQGQQVVLVPGATGRLYAQIRHGAPFDVFLAADRERPERLEREGLAVKDTRQTYAVGRLVLWSPDPQRIGDPQQTLSRADFHRLAIANPRLAPYGRAAQQTLQRLGLWQALSRKLVRGENIAQAFHFVRSGNAELGFIAAAQWQALDAARKGSAWQVPQTLHEPIEQQLVLLRDRPSARAFLEWLRMPEARELIRAGGYEVPTDG